MRRGLRIVRKVSDVTEVDAGYCWEILSLVDELELLLF